MGLQTTLAQGGFDIWMLDTKGKGRKFKVLPETAKPLTNRPEYDNQPNFINDFQLVFSAADENGNHDIIVYNFKTEKFTNLSKTADRSEFSPTLTDCGLYVSAVVMEPDSTQRLWLYPTNFGEPELLYDDIAPVGYYDWYDNKAAMFILGDPNKLVYARGKGDLLEIDNHIGRAIKRRPKTSQISYLSMKSPNETEHGLELPIRTYDLLNGKTEVLGFGLAGALDFIWQDHHYLLMAQGNNIYHKKSNHSEWEFLGTIQSDSHQNITRIAYSPDLKKTGSSHAAQITPKIYANEFQMFAYPYSTALILFFRYWPKSRINAE
ncbi:hypothetical protein [Algoriphagus boritolerans]|uniref:hypothetical protein n=1 Tax=Algoriphagus boritolerans TaxID=308111 RepID=UPI002FCE3892